MGIASVRATESSERPINGISFYQKVECNTIFLVLRGSEKERVKEHWLDVHLGRRSLHCVATIHCL